METNQTAPISPQTPPIKRIPVTIPLIGQSILLMVVATIILLAFNYSEVVMFLFFYPILIIPGLILVTGSNVAEELFKNYKVSNRASWIVAAIPAICTFVYWLIVQPFGDGVVRNYGGGVLFFGDRASFEAHANHVGIAVLIYLVFAIFPIVIGWEGTAVGKKNRNRFILCNTLFALASVGLVAYAMF